MKLSNQRVFVEGNKIYLKILEKEDASQEYCNWLNDPIVNKYLETRQATIFDLEKYIEEKLRSNKCLFFGIFWKEYNKHIGNIKLEPIDFAKSCATVGIIIGDRNYWGRGLATEAIRVLVDYMFSELRLKEVNLGVIFENKPAIRVYEKCGFVKYRTDKKALNHNGRLFDCIYMRKVNTKI